MAVAVECENEVIPNRVHDESEVVCVTEKVVGGTRVNMPIDTATVGGQENDAHNPIGTVVDPTLESSTPGAGEYDGNFTSPSCSLGLDAIFGASPQVPPSTEATATAQTAPALAQVPPAAPQASAVVPSVHVPSAAPEAPARRHLLKYHLQHQQHLRRRHLLKYQLQHQKHLRRRHLLKYHLQHQLLGIGRAHV